MGMFDRVHVPCPKCGNMLEFQSKAGKCILADYRLEDAPANIIGDITGDLVYCNSCENSIGIRTQFVAVPYIDRGE